MNYEEMKDRIAHIIRAKNLTAAEFALRLGIQPSNISHLLSGRNNPSLDFVRKLKETFPEYSLDWIIFGSGPMTVSDPFVVPAPSSVVQPEANASDSEQEILQESSVEEIGLEVPQSHGQAGSGASLQSIIMVFGDDTFKILTPR